MLLLCFIILTVVVCFWFYAREYDVLFGVYGQTFAVKRITFSILVSASLLAAVWASSIDYTVTYADSLPVCCVTEDTLPVIILSAVLVLGILELFGIRGSVIYAVLGAIAACTLAGSETVSVDWHSVLSFIAAPVMAYVLAALIRLLLTVIFRRAHIHMVRLSAIMRHVVLAGLILMAVAFGFNWGGFLAYLGDSMGITSSVWIVIGALLASIFIFLAFRPVATDEPSGFFADFSIYAVVSVGFSTAFTMLFFSFDATASLIGLSPVPLSSSLLILTSIAGVEVAQRSRLADSEDYLKVIAGSVIAPAAAMLLSYLLLRAISVEPGNRVLGLVIISAAVVVILALAFASFVINQRRQRLATDRLVYSQQQQIYEHSRALNDMELKVVISENQALHNAVEMKRQEVMNVALSIVEQKEYLESLSQIAKQLAKVDDEGERKRLISELNASLNQRLSYDRDVDSQFFYAQAESVHEDFNAKLSDSHPNLSQQEKRLATLLRLGFSSKYIATLMNITPKSVEISRYRLRQKLGLERGDNLVNYLKSI